MTSRPAEPEPAKLAFLTEPKHGEVIITLITKSGELTAKLSPEHVANLVADGARSMRGFMEAKS